MKMHKLLTAGSLALGLASIGAAQEVVYVTGSTAFRNAVTEAEVKTLSYANTSTSGTPVAGVATGAYIGGAFNTTNGSNGDTQSLVSGFDINGNAIVYTNYWTGSLAGVTDIALNSADPFIPATAATAAILGAGNGGLVYGGATPGVVPTMAMADAQFSDIAAVYSGKFPADGSAITGAGFVDAGVTATTGHSVGLVTFEWVLGNTNGAAAPFTNITQQQASALIQNGVEPLSLFTGNPGDATNFVVLIGRNEDSGTRILYEAESESGGLPTASVFGPSTKQFMINQAGEGAGYTAGYPTSNASTIAVGTGVNGLKAWPKTWPLFTEPTINWNIIGHSGYTGGGDVSKVLQTPFTPLTVAANTYSNLPATFVAGTSSIYVVSCLGTSDAASAITGHGTGLTYNGVAFSAQAAATGLYTAWNFEHAYYVPSAIGAANQPAADELADAIYNTTTANLAPVGVSYLDYVADGVTRSKEAGASPE